MKTILKYGFTFLSIVLFVGVSIAEEPLNFGGRNPVSFIPDCSDPSNTIPLPPGCVDIPLNQTCPAGMTPFVPPYTANNCPPPQANLCCPDGTPTVPGDDPLPDTIPGDTQCYGPLTNPDVETICDTRINENDMVCVAPRDNPNLHPRFKVFHGSCNGRLCPYPYRSERLTPAEIQTLRNNQQCSSSNDAMGNGDGGGMPSGNMF